MTETVGLFSLISFKTNYYYKTDIIDFEEAFVHIRIYHNQLYWIVYRMFMLPKWFDVN